MAVDNFNVIDGIALTSDSKGIILLITDHMDWVDEKQHLLTLQEKINSYISFWESKQYKEMYDNKKIEFCVIEIRFKNPITNNCEAFLNVVKQQIKSICMEINILISD